MIHSLRRSAYKNGYLILTAAWLYTLSFIIINYQTYSSSPGRVQTQFEKYIKESENTFNSLAADTATLFSLTKDDPGRREELISLNEKLNFYVYVKVGEDYFLSFWNTHVVVPAQADIQERDGKYVVKYSNGEYELIKKTIRVRNKTIVAAGMVPLRYHYFWNNKYLRTSFPAFKNLEERYDLHMADTGIGIRNGNGIRLFNLVEKPKGKLAYTEYEQIPLVMRVVSILFLLIFINSLALDVVRSHGWKIGFTFLIIVIVALRLLSYYYSFPFDFRRLELFDQLIYASTWLHRSLGDLLINTILLFWAVTFLKSVAEQTVTGMKKVEGRKSWLITACLCVVLLVMSFGSASLIRSLIVDSDISFEASNFFKLSIYSLISFLILCFIVLSFFYLSHLVILLLQKADNGSISLKYVFTAVLGLMFLTLQFDSPLILENLLILSWLLLYLLLFEYRTVDLLQPFIRSSFFIIWLILFAASVSSIIIYQNHKKELQQRRRVAEKLMEQTNPAGQNLMSVAVTYFSNPFLAENFHRFKYESSNKVIKDSLIGENFSGYLNKYDTRIYTFDSLFNPLFNDDEASFEVLTSIITNQGKKTGIPNLHYYENSLASFSYLYQRTIKNFDNQTLGYFFVIARPKGYKSESLIPELFKQVKDVSDDLNVNYSYAVYNKGQIATNFGDHEFPSTLQGKDYPLLDFEFRKFGDNNELWHKSGNKVVVVVKKGRIFYDAITLFAYLFGSFLFIIIIFHLGSFLFRSRFRWRGMRTAFRFSIRSQIQFTIVFICIFSFVIIGIATIKFYVARYKKSNVEMLVRSITMMANELQSQIASRTMFDSSINLGQQKPTQQIEATIATISEIHGHDVNFYNVNGLLLNSTQPYIYHKHILSEMMDPRAYYQLHYKRNLRYLQKEFVGRFQYESIYTPVKGHDGQTYAYVNIPYLNSEKQLNQEISNFLVTLINLNAFIFVFASAIALLLTNRIIRSFTLIGNKMRDINLGHYNEEITWKSNDEIGSLVLEYNKMVNKLEESAQALAKSEREGAWREMARQVAHEIKNPLTPMKLSIQYLQRAIDEKKPDVQELAQRVSATLVEQIDQLAKIASDFSQFANIGNVKKEVFDINDVLDSIVNLHSTNDRLELHWEKSGSRSLLNADRVQINRLFTNLIQNAIEASSGSGSAYIKITEEVSDDQITISVQDHGQGIKPEMYDRIFTPNFTTKSSGTGLGLAICKGIVEKANGSIWFVTSPGEGTSFYVTLPLYMPEKERQTTAAVLA
ncbi:GHKL domain-containing protein [Segetibacter sp. 3557_3]|uniref:sensor histidine kinase n=1 Tax=Segetibacter sp. 3557_3 TaxID=2547429 RepID=UPI00105874E9|nr:HAMP domain-containing sensor histidine kinase [Segetibacter sp. 3557_3]TDH27796.1 GHKL domain-containing protein [Segetibacter sp. 3557_3]